MADTQVAIVAITAKVILRSDVPDSEMKSLAVFVRKQLTHLLVEEPGARFRKTVGPGGEVAIDFVFLPPGAPVEEPPRIVAPPPNLKVK